MSEISCSACQELREFAPEFVLNGVTDTVAASLKNNTGINPALTVLHENCEDLNTINDCLIGRMGDELEAYDTCDWREFMGKYIPNNYELLKAMIMGDCGQWSMLDSLCKKIDALIAPEYMIYGQYYNTTPDPGFVRTGEIVSKNGEPLITYNTQNLSKSTCSIGLAYALIEVVNCEGETEKLRWHYPYIYRCFLSANAAPGDVIWRASKSQLNASGIDGDWLFDSYSYDGINSFLWADALLDENYYAKLKLTLDDTKTYFILSYEGTMMADPPGGRHTIWHAHAQASSRFSRSTER